MKIGRREALTVTLGLLLVVAAFLAPRLHLGTITPDRGVGRWLLRRVGVFRRSVLVNDFAVGQDSALDCSEPATLPLHRRCESRGRRANALGPGQPHVPLFLLAVVG